LNTVINGREDEPDRAIAISILLILRNTFPISVHSVSAITQHLVKKDSGWLIERRSVAPVTGANG
jgi:hypothetical protein